MSSYDGSLWKDEELIDKVIDRLRILGSDSTIFAADIIEDQHAEIERRGVEILRLRRLITEWADAEDRVDNDFQFRDWDSLEYGDEDDRIAAVAALRKAVGR